LCAALRYAAIVDVEKRRDAPTKIVEAFGCGGHRGVLNPQRQGEFIPCLGRGLDVLFNRVTL
jgi:hypothetical protein